MTPEPTITLTLSEADLLRRLGQHGFWTWPVRPEVRQQGLQVLLVLGERIREARTA